MKYVKAFFRGVIGAIFGLVCLTSITPALAAFTNADESNGYMAYWSFGIIALLTVLGIMAPTIRRAFGRGFLALGVCLIALPISTILLSGRVASDIVNASAASDQGAAAIGAGIAGMAATGLATVFGFILGGICLIIGLVLALGGRREVIVVEPTKN